MIALSALRPLSDLPAQEERNSPRGNRPLGRLPSPNVGPGTLWVWGRVGGRSRRVRALIPLAVLLTLILVVPSASAHAFLDTSDPAANSILATWPPRVTMRFTGPLE